MTYHTSLPARDPARDSARDSDVLEFWRLTAQWHRAATEAQKAYLG